MNKTNINRNIFRRNRVKKVIAMNLISFAKNLIIQTEVCILFKKHILM